jgi:aspartyl-tRNA(Asn)/glutamyl-tRNA(Gln) amidotransferase subunit C
MAISREQVQHVARLARVKLDDDQVEHYREDLSSILDYVDKLEELDVSEVEPTAHAGTVEPRLRDDEVEQRLDHDAILKNAPDSEAGQFRVPKVVED